jgi:replication fork clamp-binding protein CrfC
VDDNTAKVTKIIDRLREMVADADRGDIGARLDAARDRVQDPRARVVVLGQLKQGKSNLINALLNIPVCRVGDDETTSTVTMIGYGSEPAARLVVDDGDDARRIDVPMDDIRKDLSRAPAAGGARVIRLEIEVPSPLLERGLVIIDTPGSGGVGSPHAAATLGLLPAASAVLVASDVSQEYTAPEMAFIRQATELCPTALMLATKTDLYPRWRDVVTADIGHLQNIGSSLEPLPTSSALRSHAVRLKDKELNEESGFPKVLEFLGDKVLAADKQKMQEMVMTEIGSAAGHLMLAMRSELSILRDPELRKSVVAELERAKSEAKELAGRTALWQQVLGDGIADLAADSDFDLRNRFRNLTKEFEQEIDGCDPATVWEDLGTRLKDEVSAAVGDNFVWTHQRSIEVAEAVAESFATVGDVMIPHMALASVGSEIAPVDSLVDLEQSPSGVVNKVMIGMRGSYGGMMMFGMISTLVGMSMVNPFSVLAGVMLGRKTFTEDRDARLARRRGEAKMAVRRFVDDVLFEVGRESRERLRLIQRVLRDHFREIAEQTTRSLTESIQATERAANKEVSDRETRAKMVEQQLKFLGEVHTWSGAKS